MDRLPDETVWCTTGQRHAGQSADARLSGRVRICVDLQAGDTLLHCTDGLTRFVPDDRIAEMLGGAADAKSACQELVEAALAGGGKDNVTVVAARMVPG